MYDGTAFVSSDGVSRNDQIVSDRRLESSIGRLLQTHPDTKDVPFRIGPCYRLVGSLHLVCVVMRGTRVWSELFLSSSCTLTQLRFATHGRVSYGAESTCIDKVVFETLAASNGPVSGCEYDDESGRLVLFGCGSDRGQKIECYVRDAHFAGPARVMSEKLGFAHAA